MFFHSLRLVCIFNQSSWKARKPHLLLRWVANLMCIGSHIAAGELVLCEKEELCFHRVCAIVILREDTSHWRRCA